MLFMATSFLGYSQKVKMTKEARENYVNQEVLEKEKTEEKKTGVYAIMRTESDSGSEFFRISIDESPREIPTKAATMAFPELMKMTRSKFSQKSEIDILNYLAEQDWEVVAIENTSDKKTVSRKYYLRKMVTF